MTEQYESRIVGHGEVDPNELLANPKNWRIHPQVQQEALEGVLDDIGWIDQIIVNKRSGFVVDGHLRVSLALQNEQKVVPVLYVDLSEEEEALAIAIIDPISAMAETDVNILNDLLAQIDIQEGAVLEVLQRLADEVKEKSWQVPDLDDLEDEYGKTENRHFWPIVRVQVHPSTFRTFTELMESIDDEDEAQKFKALIDEVVSCREYGSQYPSHD